LIEGQWQQHRVFAVDGTKTNLPRPPRAEGYRTASDNAHYPDIVFTPLRLRLIKYVVAQTTYILGTTLMDEALYRTSLGCLVRNAG